MIKIFNILFKIDFWHVFIAKVSLKEFFDSKGKFFKKAISIKNDKFSFFGDLIIKTKNKIQILVEDFSFFQEQRLVYWKLIKIIELRQKF